MVLRTSICKQSTYFYLHRHDTKKTENLKFQIQENVQKHEKIISDKDKKVSDKQKKNRKPGGEFLKMTMFMKWNIKNLRYLLQLLSLCQSQPQKSKTKNNIVIVIYSAKKTMKRDNKHDKL